MSPNNNNLHIDNIFNPCYVTVWAATKRFIYISVLGELDTSVIQYILINLFASKILPQTFERKKAQARTRISSMRFIQLGRMRTDIKIMEFLKLNFQKCQLLDVTENRILFNII